MGIDYTPYIAYGIIANCMNEKNDLRHLYNDSFDNKDTVEIGTYNWHSEDNYAIYIKESYKAGDCFSLTKVEINNEFVAEWDAQIKHFCEANQLKYEQPFWFITLNIW